MPLGVCNECRRAFVFDGTQETHERCPRCGASLKPVSPHDLDKLPQVPPRRPDAEKAVLPRL